MLSITACFFIAWTNMSSAVNRKNKVKRDWLSFCLHLGRTVRWYCRISLRICEAARYGVHQEKSVGLKVKNISLEDGDHDLHTYKNARLEFVASNGCRYIQEDCKMVYWWSPDVLRTSAPHRFFITNPPQYHWQPQSSLSHSNDKDT